MSQFEFFMTFYALLIGLAVAELMLGTANLIRQRDRPRFGVLTPLLIALLFVQSVALFIDAWWNLRSVEITMAGLAVPTLIGVAIFSACVLALPRGTDDWADLDDYFFRMRRISLGLLLCINLLILVHEVRQVPPGALVAYGILNAIPFSLIVATMVLRRRVAVAACLAAMIAYYIYGYLAPDASLFRLISRLIA